MTVTFRRETSKEMTKEKVKEPSHYNALVDVCNKLSGNPSISYGESGSHIVAIPPKLFDFKIIIIQN